MANSGASWRGAPGKTELYLVGTASDVAPSSITEEAGAMPGFLVPAVTNRGQASVGVTGKGYRASNRPTVVLSITGTVGLPVSLADEIQTALETADGPVRIEDLIADVRRQAMGTVSGTRGAVQLPRLAIQRSNHDLLNADDGVAIGITREFNRWPDASTTIVAPFGLTFGSSPSAIEMSDGTYRLIVYAISDTGGDNDPVLLLYSHNPAVDEGWQYQSSAARTIGASDGVPPMAAACAVLIGHDVYVYLACNLDTGLGYKRGQLYVYRLAGASPGSESFTPVAGPISISDYMDRDTACGHIAATVVSGGTLLAVTGHVMGVSNSTVMLGYSADQSDWGGTDRDHGRFVSLGEFATTVTTLTSDLVARGDSVRDIQFASTMVGWCCTVQGRIYASLDGGKSWVEQDSPVSRANMAAGVIQIQKLAAVSTNIVYAVGAGGLVLKTEDGGTTWKVQRFNGSTGQKAAIAQSAWTSDADRAAPFPSTYLRGVTFDSATLGWIVGDHGTFARTTDGGTTWTEMAGGTQRGPGDYYDVISERSSPAIVWACGDTAVHKNNPDASHKVSRLLKIGSADTTPSYTYFLAAPSGSAKLVAMTRPDSGVMYAVTSDGTVYRRPVGDYGWSKIAELGGTATDIFSPAADHAVVFVTGRGGIWRSMNGTEVFPSAPAFVRQETQGTQNEAMWWFDGAVGVVGGLGSIEGTFVTFDDRSGAALVTLRDQSVVLAARNIAQGVTELYRITDPASALSRTTLVDRALQFDLDLPYPNFGYPSAVRCPNGEIIVWGSNGIPPPTVTPSSPGARTVVYCTTYKHAVTGIETGIETSASKPAATLVDGSGTVTVAFTPVDGYTVEVYRAAGFNLPFYWIASVSYGNAAYVDTVSDPVNLTRQAPSRGGARISTDGLRWLWADDTALPMPLGTMSPDGAFAANQLVAPTLFAPTGGRLFTCVASIDNEIGTWVAREWAAQSAAVGATQFAPLRVGIAQWVLDDVRVLITGPEIGDQWTLAPRYDYPRAYLAEDSPSIYCRTVNNDAEWVINWDRASAAITAVLGAGELWEVFGCALIGTNFRTANFGLSDGVSTSVFRSRTRVADVDAGTFTSAMGGVLGIDDTKQWIADQWAPGVQQFYLHVPSLGEFRILTNSATAITIERAAAQSSLAGLTYTIYGDRFFWSGAATNDGNLYDGVRRYGRIARLTIPAQATVDGYRRIGRPIIGVYTRSTVPTLPDGEAIEDRSVRGYGDSPRWRPITNTQEQTGISGISHVAHFGKIGQAWALPYDHIEWWQRDQILNPLLKGNRPRRAFCIMFDSASLTTLKLVRLDDLPELVNTIRDRYSWVNALREVV